jgi:hypothetical protein
MRVILKCNITSVDEIKSIHELEFSVKWVGSLINWIILYFTNILDILLFWGFNWSSLKSLNTTIVFIPVSTAKSIECGQPFLNVNVRYHCPTYGIFKVPKTLHACFKRRIWLYDRGNYNQYREKLQRVDWDEHIRLLKHACNVLGTLNIPYIGQWYRTFTLRNGWPTWIRSMTNRTFDRFSCGHRYKYNCSVRWL